MRINSASTLITSASLICIATATTKCCVAQEVLTYGVDPVPNSQYWSGPYGTFYGLDPVPSTSLAGEPYPLKYGQDPIPDARIYTRSLDVAPAIVGQQRLTQSTEGTRPSSRSTPWRYRRGR